MTDVVEVHITVGTPDEAAHLATVLVRERLAACVQDAGQITSTYRWRGEVSRDTERLLVAKTTRDRFGRLAARVRELHSYEVPEIVALPVVEVDDAYAAWLRDSLEG